MLRTFIRVQSSRPTRLAILTLKLEFDSVQYCSLSQPFASRNLATAALSESSSQPNIPPLQPSPSSSSSAQISQIVDDISGLTLLQAADLVSQLKVRFLSYEECADSQLLQLRLNIQEVVAPVATPAVQAAALPSAAEVEEVSLLNRSQYAIY